MPFTDNALLRIEARGLDIELVDRLSFSSETKRWPVYGEGGKTDWVDVEALTIPFIRKGQVVRLKWKAWERPEGSPAYLQQKGAPRILFNEDALRDDSLVGQPVIITEGELDCVAALQGGFARSVSVPDGAPPPGERDRKSLEESPKYEWLREREIAELLSKDRAPEIILATDGDDNGAALLQDLSILLGRFRCKYLVYPKAPKEVQARLGRERCKDLNEVLQFYGVAGVKGTIERAQWIKVKGVYRMSELPPLPADQIFPLHDERLEKLGDHYRIRLGDFVVITGVPGYGKTTVANDLYCQAAYEYGLKIAWASFEQSPQRDHRRALRSWWGENDDRWGRRGRWVKDMTNQQIAEADRWIDEQHVFIVPDEDDDVDLEWMLDRMEAAVVQHGVKIIVIDPWNEMDHSRGRDETMTEYVGRAIRTFKKFARKFQVHLVIVAHPTKMSRDRDGKYLMPSLYDISDSANWYNKCDIGIIVHKENSDETIIKVQKSKYWTIIGRPGEVVAHYNSETHRFRVAGSIH